MMAIVGHPKVTERAYAQGREAKARATQFAEAAVHNGLGREAALLPRDTVLRLKAQIERDFLVATMEASPMTTSTKRPDEVLRALEPYIDCIICYASTVDEHEGNRVAKMVRDYFAAPTNESPAPQPPVEGLREELSDPNIVHLNMLRGDIAKPTREQIKHLYPELFSSDPAIITDFDRFYGDPVERFKAMADANHEGPIDVAHFKMWCRIAEREIRHARALASPSLTAGPWQPMNTAPRDGSWFLACATTKGWGATRIVRFAYPDDRMPIHGEGTMWPSPPTHWMPLPPAPAALTEQPSEAPPSAPDVREAISPTRLQEIKRLAHVWAEIADDEEAAPTGSMLGVINELLAALSQQPVAVADREAIARIMCCVGGCQYPDRCLAMKTKAGPVLDAIMTYLLHPQPAKGERP